MSYALNLSDLNELNTLKKYHEFNRSYAAYLIIGVYSHKTCWITNHLIKFPILEHISYDPRYFIVDSINIVINTVIDLSLISQIDNYISSYLNVRRICLLNNFGILDPSIVHIFSKVIDIYVKFDFRPNIYIDMFYCSEYTIGNDDMMILNKIDSIIINLFRCYPNSMFNIFKSKYVPSCYDYRSILYLQKEAQKLGHPTLLSLLSTVYL